MPEKDLNLTDLIDLKFLQEIQDNFAKTMNLASLTIDRTGPVTKPSNYTEMCKGIRTCSCLGCNHCNESDLVVSDIAAEKGEPAVYTCHAGLTIFQSQ